VTQGVVKALSKALAHFKVYDQVLTEIYKFCGPSFNFELARDVLAALDNIVNIGEMEAEEKQKLNHVLLRCRRPHLRVTNPSLVGSVRAVVRHGVRRRDSGSLAGDAPRPQGGAQCLAPEHPEPC